MSLQKAKCPYHNSDGKPCAYEWVPRMPIEEVRQCPSCKKNFAPHGSGSTALPIIALPEPSTPRGH
jgi:hypothetical protein